MITPAAPMLSPREPLGKLKTFISLKSRQEGIPSHLVPVLGLLRELESLLGCDAIDVEFAVDKAGALYLLQVRPLRKS